MNIDPKILNRAIERIERDFPDLTVEEKGTIEGMRSCIKQGMLESALTRIMFFLNAKMSIGILTNQLPLYDSLRGFTGFASGKMRFLRPQCLTPFNTSQPEPITDLVSTIH